MAEDNVQPVPWVDVDSRRGAGKRVKVRPSHRISVAESFEVAALDEHVARPQGADPARRLLHLGLGGHGHVGEGRRLVKVRRHHVGQGEQLGHQGLARVGLEEGIAGLGDHHRIEDDAPLPVGAQALGHRADDRRRGEHADLHRIGAEVVQHHVDLLGHERGLHVDDAVDAHGVLGGERGDDGHAEHAKGAEGLQIRLDAGTPAGVRAGDGQGLGHGHTGRQYTRSMPRAADRRRPGNRARRTRSLGGLRGPHLMSR